MVVVTDPSTLGVTVVKTTVIGRPINDAGPWIGKCRSVNIWPGPFEGMVRRPCLPTKFPTAQNLPAMVHFTFSTVASNS